MRQVLKIFNNKKGEDDWKVWSRANNFLSDYMLSKRNRRFTPVKLRTDIEVIIIIKDGKDK